MLHLKAAELLTSPQVFIERRKIKKKSANNKIFLQQFLEIIAFKSRLKWIINTIKENKSN